jgi:hypothetical protein
MFALRLIELHCFAAKNSDTVEEDREKFGLLLSRARVGWGAPMLA